jgi:DNA-binding SARP family transcriptional activator
VPAKPVRDLPAAARPLHIAELADALWDEPLSPAQVRSRMPNVIARAHTATCPLIQRSGDLVAIEGHVAVDADRFESAAHRALALPDGDTDRYEAAMTASLLYGGDLLPTDPYADWALLRREQLRRKFLAVTDLAASCAFELDHVDQAIDFIEAAIRHDPLDLERYERGVVMLDRAGRHSAARAMQERGERVRLDLGL